MTENLRVTLIHAVVPAMESTARYFGEAAGVVPTHLLDESLLPLAQQRGGVDDFCVERLADLVELAVAAGTDAVVVTCNAYSAATAQIAARRPALPVLSIDEVLVETAIGLGERIGLIGTVAVGLRQQTELFSVVSTRLGAEIALAPRLREDAFAALRAGDRSGHDELIADEAEAMTGVDVIVLGQASMAPAADLIESRGSVRVPVLASPQLMVRRLRDRASPV
ncbi:aspartate/glutamate racemase family protein [Jiangella asiatica]|uniref:Asp/Glu racemase n=1 Tax=Jiangella asiatica TaxID=2530372 RepID=A0A4R5CRT2_9ACTN|nr:aspartate/glutamate racemase family protein [Jiangella asiatica]TDE01144.1 hypothetical protein E1269_23560 [Jiangella asiatica]